MNAPVAASEKQSRIGKRPIPLPKGVNVNLSGRRIEVQGQKGKLSAELPGQVAVARDGDVLQITTDAEGRDSRRLQGLGRALVASMVKGASEGYERVLELIGTGYRCEVKGRKLQLSLGFSHPVVVDLPEGVSASVPGDSKGAVLILGSADKALLGQVSATIRSYRPPEPYGGKGIRYRGEQIRRKAGKSGKGKTK
jgi:large subunit ribosomal protein L6